MKVYRDLIYMDYVIYREIGKNIALDANIKLIYTEDNKDNFDNNGKDSIMPSIVKEVNKSLHIEREETVDVLKELSKELYKYTLLSRQEKLVENEEPTNLKDDNTVMIFGGVNIYDFCDLTSIIKNKKDFLSCFDNKSENVIIGSMKLGKDTEDAIMNAPGIRMNINSDENEFTGNFAMFFNTIIKEARIYHENYVEKNKKNFEKEMLEKNFLAKTGLLKIRP